MKMAKPVSMDPRPEHDRGNNGPDNYFDLDLRRELRKMIKEGLPVSRRKDSFRYRDKTENVRFDASITDLANVNQWCPNWVINAFKIQIWAERVLQVVSVVGVEKIEQLANGQLHWWRHGRPFGAFQPRDNSQPRNDFLGLISAEGEHHRVDLFDPIGPVNHVFLLDSMDRTERALTTQITLEHMLNKKEVATNAVPNGLDLNLEPGAIHIRVDRDNAIKVHQSLYPPPSQEFLERICGYVEKFEDSRKAALRQEIPPDAMDSDTLDLL
jgi:hypothetical protein